MSAQVIDLSGADRLDRAWEDLRAHTARAIDDHSLFVNREFMENQIRLQARFSKLFLMQDAG